MLIQETVRQAEPLSAAGWATMIFSLVLVWVGTLVCFKKVLESPSEEKVPTGFGA